MPQETPSGIARWQKSLYRPLFSYIAFLPLALQAQLNALFSFFLILLKRRGKLINKGIRDFLLSTVKSSSHWAGLHSITHINRSLNFYFMQHNKLHWSHINVIIWWLRWYLKLVMLEFSILEDRVHETASLHWPGVLACRFLHHRPTNKEQYLCQNDFWFVGYSWWIENKFKLNVI